MISSKSLGNNILQKSSKRKKSFFNQLLPSVNDTYRTIFTEQKMKFSIKDFFSECDQTCPNTNTKEILNALMENFIFCAVLPHRPLKNSQKKLAFLQVILLIMTTIRKKSWTVMTMTNMN